MLHKWQRKKMATALLTRGRSPFAPHHRSSLQNLIFLGCLLHHKFSLDLQCVIIFSPSHTKLLFLKWKGRHIALKCTFRFHNCAIGLLDLFVRFLIIYCYDHFLFVINPSLLVTCGTGPDGVGLATKLSSTIDFLCLRKLCNQNPSSATCCHRNQTHEMDAGEKERFYSSAGNLRRWETHHRVHLNSSVQAEDL